MITTRLFQVICAITVISLGVWVAHTAQSAREKGDSFLDSIFTDPDKEKFWKDFFDSLMQTPMRVWFVIGAGSWTLLFLLFLALSHNFFRHLHRHVLIILELLTAIILSLAFAAIASLATELEPLCYALDVVAPELVAFFRVCPISKAYAIAAGLAWFLFVLTTITVLVQNCCSRGRKKKMLSFEPTTSEERNGYKAVSIASVHTHSTMYDPYVPKAGMKGQESGVAVTEVREKARKTLSGTQS